jgi:Tetratricopeptide repeat
MTWSAGSSPKTPARLISQCALRSTGACGCGRCGRPGTGCSGSIPSRRPGIGRSSVAQEPKATRATLKPSPTRSAPAATSCGRSPPTPTSPRLPRVLTRAHQTLIWERTRHMLRLRGALRDYFPAALAAYKPLRPHQRRGAEAAGQGTHARGRSEADHLPDLGLPKGPPGHAGPSPGDPGRAAHHNAALRQIANRLVTPATRPRRLTTNLQECLTPPIPPRQSSQPPGRSPGQIGRPTALRSTPTIFTTTGKIVGAVVAWRQGAWVALALPWSGLPDWAGFGCWVGTVGLVVCGAPVCDESGRGVDGSVRRRRRRCRLVVGDRVTADPGQAGPTDPAAGQRPDTDVATRLGNLAATYYALGRARETLPLFERAPTIAHAALGPDHPRRLRPTEQSRRRLSRSGPTCRCPISGDEGEAGALNSLGADHRPKSYESSSRLCETSMGSPTDV